MEFLFYIAAAVSVIATARVVTHLHAVHALLYLVVAMMALSLMFYLLGAPFAAVLEIIIYAGAIVVLFVFVVMLLNQGPLTVEQERRWLPRGAWLGPGLLALLLLGEVAFLIAFGSAVPSDVGSLAPKTVGLSLYGPYIIGVELASMLLLPGLIGAYHVGRRLARGDRQA